MIYFDVATGLFFFFFLLKIAFLGFRELKRKGNERFKDRPTTWLQYSQPPLILLMILMVNEGICLGYFRISAPFMTGFLLRGIGLLLTCAGGILAVSAIRTIGKDMQSDIAVNKGHVFRTKAAYSIVRHPMYLSLILLGIGAGLSTMNLLLLGFTLFVLAPVQFLRAKKEEELFLKHFGSAYLEYQKKTPMLFPFRLY